MATWWQKLRMLLTLAFLTTLPVVGQEELLKKSDVRATMEQLFKKHVAKHEMTPVMLQQAIRQYLETFDPQRIYLLAQDIHPWLDLTPEQMAAYVEQYQESDLSVFEKLNMVIANSIERERKLREVLPQQESELFAAAQRSASMSNAEYLAYATTVEELRQRLQSRVVGYIRTQVVRYGKVDISQHQAAVLKNFNEEEREYELPYLYVDEESNPLPLAQREHFFALRVLKALAHSLDPHTSIYNPEEAYDLRTRLEKGLRGVGLIVHKSGTTIVVDKIIPGSPAAKKEDIKPGDHLLKINDKLVTLLPFDTVLDLLRGEKAAKVQLVLQHQKGISASTTQAIYKVDLEPAMIVIDEGRVEVDYVPYKDGVIGTIALRSFYKGAEGVNSENDVRLALEKLRKVGPIKGLILDLRGNTGGFLTQAVKVAGLFITSGVVVISKYANGDEHYYRDIDGKAYYQGPLVVLTSKTTASAAEIVAQALQDYGVALVVGDSRTYGKGTIQSQTVTGDQATPSYFKVTVGKYYTVSGRTPQKDGVKANIVVPSELIMEEIGEEYYADTPDADHIPSAYSDQLKDVDPSFKSWFARYYIPALQMRTDEWDNFVPWLQKESAARLRNVPEYQKLFALANRDGSHLQPPPTINAQALHTSQQQEAVNIVKDMISLDAKLKVETPATADK